MRKGYKYSINKKKSNNFEHRHGIGATEKFERILDKTGSLTKVAYEFGFTRAQASHVFKDLFDITFTEYKRQRMRISS